jgi:flagellar basal body rod protein FlgG
MFWAGGKFLERTDYNIFRGDKGRSMDDRKFNRSISRNIYSSIIETSNINLWTNGINMLSDSYQLKIFLLGW